MGLHDMYYPLLFAQVFAAPGAGIRVAAIVLVDSEAKQAKCK
jgi:hypothetical protein